MAMPAETAFWRQMVYFLSSAHICIHIFIYLFSIYVWKISWVFKKKYFQPTSTESDSSDCYWTAASGMLSDYGNSTIWEGNCYINIKPVTWHSSTLLIQERVMMTFKKLPPYHICFNKRAQQTTGRSAQGSFIFRND